MKKWNFLLSVMMLSAIAYADSHITIESLNIGDDRQSLLTINYELDEEHTVCNYQMELQLPKGISVVGTDVFLSDCHLGHTGSIVNNIVVVTSMNTVLNVTRGRLLSILVEASPTLSVGTQLQGTLHNVKLGQLDETSINLDDIDFSINIDDTDETTGSHFIREFHQKSEENTYTLSGQKVRDTESIHCGIYVKRGKKVVNR